MSQYKVPQDVEAEDKIIGFLTLKQFLYATTGFVWGGLSFAMFKEVPVIFILVGIPPTLLFLLLGLYRRDDQPFEALFLALVSFIAKPRKRIWQKEPLLEVFKVEEAPAAAAEIVRNPAEIRGQLDRIAQIVDTRGWASKQPEVQEPAATATPLVESDRLVMPAQPAVPAGNSGPSHDVTLQDDILDFQNNPNASTLNDLIENAVQDVRQEALNKMRQTPTQASAPPPPSAVVPGRVVLPNQSNTPQPATNTTSATSVSKMTQNPIADILKLAMENDDLTVSQIAAQANKKLALPEGEAIAVRKPEPNQTFNN